MGALEEEVTAELPVGAEEVTAELPVFVYTTAALSPEQTNLLAVYTSRQRRPGRNGHGRHRAQPSAATRASKTAGLALSLLLISGSGYMAMADELALSRGYSVPGYSPSTVDPGLVPPAPPMEPPQPTLVPVSVPAPKKPAPSPAPTPKPAPTSAPAPKPEPAPAVKKPAPPPPPPPPPPPAPKKPPVVSASCKIQNSLRGDVRPGVREVACFLDAQFPKVTGLLGLGPGSVRGSEHPDGLAIDFLVGKLADGDEVAACAARHFNDWNIDYIIWKQAILTKQGGSFRPMEDRGGRTANHFDHVHISFRGTSAPHDLEC